jgi:hypothetical protein
MLPIYIQHTALPTYQDSIIGWTYTLLFYDTSFVLILWKQFPLLIMIGTRSLLPFYLSRVQTLGPLEDGDHGFEYILMYGFMLIFLCSEIICLWQSSINYTNIISGIFLCLRNTWYDVSVLISSCSDDWLSLHWVLSLWKLFIFILILVGGACSTHGKRNAHKTLVGKPEGKKPLGKPRRRWEDNIKMNLRVMGWKGGDWIHLAQNRGHWWDLVNTVMNLWVPHNAGNFLTRWVTSSFSRSPYSTESVV